MYVNPLLFGTVVNSWNQIPVERETFRPLRRHWRKKPNSWENQVLSRENNRISEITCELNSNEASQIHLLGSHDCSSLMASFHEAEK